MQFLDHIYGSFTVCERAKYPEPVLEPEDRSANVDPLEHVYVREDKDANSLVSMLQFYNATKLREEVQRNRVDGVAHGFAAAGRFQACCDPETRRRRMLKTDGITASLYLGHDSPAVLYP